MSNEIHMKLNLCQISFMLNKIYMKWILCQMKFSSININRSDIYG